MLIFQGTYPFCMFGDTVKVYRWAVRYLDFDNAEKYTYYATQQEANSWRPAFIPDRNEKQILLSVEPLDASAYEWIDDLDLTGKHENTCLLAEQLYDMGKVAAWEYLNAPTPEQRINDLESLTLDADFRLLMLENGMTDIL